MMSAFNLYILLCSDASSVIVSCTEDVQIAAVLVHALRHPHQAGMSLVWPSSLQHSAAFSRCLAECHGELSRSCPVAAFSYAAIAFLKAFVCCATSGKKNRLLNLFGKCT